MLDLLTHSPPKNQDSCLHSTSASTSSTEKYQVIQPVAKSSFKPSRSAPVVFGWSLPGHGEPYADCGEKMIFGCLDVEAHSQACLDKEVVGKVFVDMRRRTCLRASCPICYEKWASKEAHKIEYRLSQWRGSGRPIHLMISVPRSLWHIPPEDLRPRIYRVARKVGCFGSSCIIHPNREKCKFCGSLKDEFTKKCESCGCSEFSWYFSPHFHLIGYGWIRGDKVKDLYEKEGWITKNLGIRDSVLSTAFYQLSHAGIKKGKHTVTWFGRLSYNKLKVVPEIVERKKCPLCGADLGRIRWVGEGNMPFEDEGEYFDKADNWRDDSSSDFDSLLKRLERRS